MNVTASRSPHEVEMRAGSTAPTRGLRPLANLRKQDLPSFGSVTSVPPLRGVFSAQQRERFGDAGSPLNGSAALRVGSTWRIGAARRSVRKGADWLRLCWTGGEGRKERTVLERCLDTRVGDAGLGGEGRKERTVLEPSGGRVSRAVKQLAAKVERNGRCWSLRQPEEPTK